MLRDTYIPSHVEPEDLAPEILLEQKLEEIAAARPKVLPVRDESLPIPVLEGCYDVYLRGFVHIIPYVKPLRFQLDEKNGETELFVHRIDVGPEELKGHGIGTQLLQKAVEFGVKTEDNLTTLATGPVNMGLVNTIRKVLNQDSDEEHVAFRKDNEWYGPGYTKPLEAVFDDFEYHEGDRYLVSEVRGKIDREHFLGKRAVTKAVAELTSSSGAN